MIPGTPLLSSLDARIEAAVFAAKAPVKEKDLAKLLPDSADIKGALQRIAAFWSDRGVRVQEGVDGWSVRTAEEYMPERQTAGSRRLSTASIATLAVIAMHQPVTVQQIERIRGIKLGRGIIEGLKTAGLVVEMGRRGGSGQPIAYGVTLTFLERFDLESLSDLPTSEEAMMLDLDTGEPAPVSPAPDLPSP